MADQEQLTLIPQLIPDPNIRRQRENERRIEQFVREMLAKQQQGQRSYVRRFLIMD